MNGSKTGNGGYSARADRRNTTAVILYLHDRLSDFDGRNSGVYPLQKTEKG